MERTEDIYVWQFQGEKGWHTMDLMLCLYLHILPWRENNTMKVTMSESKLEFTVTRSSRTKAVLKYTLMDGGCGVIEYALQSVGRHIKDGVYIPSIWERDLTNRSLSEVYLYTIDLKVLEMFGNSKYTVWWQCLKDWVHGDRIVKVSSMENWIAYHSFHFYSNWRCATKQASTMTRMWFADTNKQNVKAKGFGEEAVKLKFHVHLEGAVESMKKRGKAEGRALLCNVCITEKQEESLMNGKDSLRLVSSKICAYPELCV